ncbi:fasciclin domain-containing protein [Pseudidiomarina terrestris]|uniref:fasciclin domain-containing protein n=1 Tax=Pseudidiomarina terrestris TaxID=2820060 RepID=UPI00265A423A|nr:fasciclin domain-containing protein [Pseudidiomarina sp. 1APR75-33.1]
MLNVMAMTKWLAGALLVAAVSTTAVAHNHGKKKDIVDIAAGDDQFSTLVTAVQAADLVDTLKSDGPFTVFAPTNEAFAALPDGVLASLMMPENKSKLQAVLTYHVLGSKVMSSDIAGKQLSTATVQGEEVAIDATDGVKVGGANVVAADIKASNGVIHVIDAVILPPSMQ